uniref:Ribosomal protein L36 n=1 Tax=Eustoma russellianum TaxID=52518 RepID=A0A7T7FM26_EUSRU|nr:ribosomal protein L36 [Eustoma grandiflorum]
MIRFFSESDYPCLCLCLGLEQITISRPLLRISRHFSQILRTEALIFILVIPYLKFESISQSTSLKTISFLIIFQLDSHSHERHV